MLDEKKVLVNPKEDSQKNWKFQLKKSGFTFIIDMAMLKKPPIF